MSAKPIEIEQQPLLCLVCGKAIESETGFVPIMFWRDESVDTMRAGPDGFPRKRIARLAHTVSALHLECIQVRVAS